MKRILENELESVIKMFHEEEEDWREWVNLSSTSREKLEKEEKVKILLNTLHLLECKVKKRIFELNEPEPKED